MRTMGIVTMSAFAAAALTACGGTDPGAKAPAAAAPAPAASSANAAPPPVAPAPAAVPAAPTSAALPADGGELGRDYKELIAAYQALDTAKAAKFFGKDAFAGDPLDHKFVDSILPDMLKVHPAGGVQQADRATLFLDGGDWHGHYSASRTADGWIFDSLNPSTWQQDRHTFIPDCHKAKYFPCGARTFPDAKVSGNEKIFADAETAPPSGVLFDGFGVRMLGADGKLKSTRIVLSNEAFDPATFASADETSYEPSFGVVQIDVAPDGKATLMLYNNSPSGSKPTRDVTSALTLDTATANRARGRLKFDAPDLAKIDVTFDVDTSSSCVARAVSCGNR